MGYKIIPSNKAVEMRGSLYNVILKDVLYKRLKAINNFEYIGRQYEFSNNNIIQAMEDIDEALTDGLINKDK